MKKREVKYDFMRVLMSLLVVCCHASFPLRISDNSLLNNAVRTFLAMCNGIFFMLSGKFNLKKKFESKSDYYNYYVYFDCAEPTARMLRASLAEDESHLHGRLSQVKFDNTSVC